jgi:hypothetical protein
VWTGHAAGNCRYALRRFARDLGPAQDLVIQIAADYHEVAETARKQGEALSELVILIADMVDSFGIEFLAKRLLNLSDAAEEAGELAGLVAAAAKVIEIFHAIVEGKNINLTDLCQGLALLTRQPFAVNLPDDMPALPAPAGR